MPQLISASRRTDIPAFYSEWFVNRLKAGFVYVQQPYNRKLFRVSLRPEDVSAIVFWSKNYAPLLSNLGRIEQTTKNLFFHFTITSNQELELHTPDYQDAIRDYIFLSQRYSAEQLAWRFDPICLTDKLLFEAYEDLFVRCAERLKGHTRNCIISFAHPYKKTTANLQKYAHQAMLELSEQKKKEYALRLAARAEQYGIRLFACCNDYLVSGNVHPIGDRNASIGIGCGQQLSPISNEVQNDHQQRAFSNGVQKARCIDGHALTEIFKTKFDTRPAASRKECGCTKSADIGAYDTCAHGCLYCYANNDKDKARAARKQHNPDWNALMMQVNEMNAREEQQPMLPY